MNQGGRSSREGASRDARDTFAELVRLAEHKDELGVFVSLPLAWKLLAALGMRKGNSSLE